MTTGRINQVSRRSTSSANRRANRSRELDRSPSLGSRALSSTAARALAHLRRRVTTRSSPTLRDDYPTRVYFLSFVPISPTFDRVHICRLQPTERTRPFVYQGRASSLRLGHVHPARPKSTRMSTCRSSD